MRTTLFILFIGFAICVNAQVPLNYPFYNSTPYPDEGIKTETLFSTTGDTALVLEAVQMVVGGKSDSLWMGVIARRGDTVKRLDGFLMASKSHNVVRADYPQAIIGKYKLTEDASDMKVDSCSDVVLEQKTIKNRKGKRDPESVGQDTAYYLYKCTVKMSIKVCGKVLVNGLNVEYDYDSQHILKNPITKSWIIPNFVKMKNKDIYYLTVVIMSYTEYVAPNKLDNGKVATYKRFDNLFQQDYYISCK